MATIADMFVNIGADVSQFERETKKMQSEMKSIQKDTSTMAASLGISSAQMSKDWQHMSSEMQAAMKAAKDKLLPFKKQQQEVRHEFFKMSQSMGTYTGTNQQFMSELETLGKKQKTITENMMKNNDMLKTGFIQGVATMLARSGQADKIAANFTRMGNPLYTVNNGLLKIGSNMERIAKQGAPTVLALKMLGPNANMKELQDMTMMIGQGLMRAGALALVAGASFVAMTSKLKEAALANEELAKASDNADKVWSTALKPLVSIFSAFLEKVIAVKTFVGELVNKFNEANPVLAGMIQAFGYLFVGVLAILAPMAVGIGLTGGLTAAFSGLWVVIGPFVLAFLSVAGTAAIVAAAIVAVGAALYLLWTKTDWFKSGVLAIWEAIKNATLKVWNFIYTNGIKPAMDAISNYVLVIMTKIKLFWFEYGDQIMSYTKVAWDAIKGYLKVVMDIIVMDLKIAWELIAATIKAVWATIKAVIDIATNTIGGIIRAFMKVLKGDWSGAWEDVKGIFTGNFDIMIDYIKGMGKIFFDAGKGLIQQIAKGIKNAAGDALGAVEDVVKKIRDFLPFSPAKIGPLSDLDKLDFGGPISDSLYSAIPKIKGLMTDLVTLPDINGSNNLAAVGSGDTYHLNVQLNAGDLQEMQDVYSFFDMFKQVKRARG